MATNLIFRVNHTVTDHNYADMVSGEDFWLDVSDDDSLILTAGSTAVADGEDTPTSTELNRAATLISDSVSVEVAKYILLDDSESELVEVFNAGRNANQYVFCCSFDGATATEPQLEAWDDSDLDTLTSVCLGSGSPAGSWYHATCTTTSPGSPATTWVGTRLGGNSGSNVVLLNDGSGALTVAKDLYFNFYCEIPSGVTASISETPVLAIVYTTN